MSYVSSYTWSAIFCAEFPTVRLVAGTGSDYDLVRFAGILSRVSNCYFRYGNRSPDGPLNPKERFHKFLVIEK